MLCDVDRHTYNIDIADAARRVTPRTKAIVPVHLFGLCADIPALAAALPKDVVIIEDAACAAGAALGERHAGGLGELGVFSFHPRKSITTGEGGMVTTNDDRLAETCNMLRNHGASISEEQRHKGPRPYLLPEFNMLGFNYRMTDLQGAVGLVQLGKFLLASTKDQAHRVYLRDDIFAEVTLRFQAGAFEVWPWTYADYHEEAVRAFLNQARGLLYEKVVAIRG